MLLKLFMLCFFLKSSAECSILEIKMICILNVIMFFTHYDVFFACNK